MFCTQVDCCVLSKEIKHSIAVCQMLPETHEALPLYLRVYSWPCKWENNYNDLGGTWIETWLDTWHTKTIHLMVWVFFVYHLLFYFVVYIRMCHVSRPTSSLCLFSCHLSVNKLPDTDFCVWDLFRYMWQWMLTCWQHRGKIRWSPRLYLLHHLGSWQFAHNFVGVHPLIFAKF